MAEKDEFSGYTVEPRGKGGEPTAVFQLRSPQTEYEYRQGRYQTIRRTEVAANEPSLVTRIGNLEKSGHDASMSREALASVRVAKGNAPSNG